MNNSPLLSTLHRLNYAYSVGYLIPLVSGVADLIFSATPYINWPKEYEPFKMLAILLALELIMTVNSDMPTAITLI